MQTKVGHLRLRLGIQERERYEAAARAAEMTLSAWARMVLGSVMSTKAEDSPGAEPKKKAVSKKAVESIDLPEWLPRLQWDAWIEARTKARHPPTNFALRLALSRLEKFRGGGHNIAQILANSALNNWSNVYEPKQ